MREVAHLTVKRRIAVLFLGAAAAVLFLWLRLIYLQVFLNPSLTGYALDHRLRPIMVDARRGTIYDRHSQELAVSVSADAVYAVPAEVKNPQETAAVLSKILDLEYGQVLARLTKRSAAEWIKKRLTPEEARAIREAALPGIGLVENPQRFYPNGTLAAQVLGIAGIDNQGLEGLEYQYDRYLRGIPGRVMAERDAAGREIPGGLRQYVPPREGYDLVLTIDRVIQYVAERELRRAMTETKARKGVLIVMDPRTGEILALANEPSYDPNRYNDFPVENRRNYAVTDLYEPGSTFKVITAAAALEERLVTPGRRFYDPGYIVVGGRRIRCWKAGGHGSQNFVEATENSCNVAFATLGLELGGERFYKYIKAFGFGEKTGLDFPGEAVGQVHPPDKMTTVGWANIGFGQGISVTPLQLLTALSAVANDGLLMRPYLVREIRERSGKVIERREPQPLRQVISREAARELRRILRSVVVNGSGRRAEVPGYRAAGKTGTAQIAEGGIYSRTKVVASFAGFAPFDEPVVAILVALYEPQTPVTYGGVLAAPVFQAVLGDVMAYLKVPPRLETPPPPGRGPHGEELAVVPNARSLFRAEAEQVVTKAKLRFRFTGHGQVVIDQTPKPGAQVPVGTLVLLHTADEGTLGEDIVP
ncbi:MAG: penicillin-binding transpeptidase domain-containing protein [Bacillota bacterium]|nr:penicillin-binding transpeptidase domain-containing protein [Bacillota bacterium]